MIADDISSASPDKRKIALISIDQFNSTKFLFVLIFIEFLFYFFINNYTVYYILFFSLIFLSLFLKYEYIILLILFILPNQRLFVYPDTPYSLINIILLTTLIKYLFTKNRFPLKQLVFPFLVVTYAAFTAILIGNFSNIIFGIKAVVLILAIILYVRDENFNLNKIMIKLLMFYILGCITANVLGLFLGQQFSASMLGTKLRFEGGDFNNANILGFDLSFAMSLIMVLIMITRRHILSYLSVFFALLVFGMLTQSRSFYFSVILILLYAISINFIFSGNKKKQLKIIFILIIFIIGFYYYIKSYPESVLGNIFYAGWERIVAPRKGDISGNRLFLWATYLNYLFHNHRALWFGIGSFNIISKVGTINVAHNFILEVIVSWGIIGFSIFISYFYFIWSYLKKILFADYNNIKNSRINLIAYLPFFILLFTGMTGHNFLGNAFLIKMFLSFLIIFYIKKRDINTKRPLQGDSKKGFINR